jgi:hypothetical protein
MERYLNARTNHIYLLTYLISSVYDESTIPLEDGQTGYLNITPEYLDIFKAVVEARRNSPIVTADTEQFTLIKNIGISVEILKILLAVLFKFDETLQKFIDGQIESLINSEKQTDTKPEESDSFKKLNQGSKSIVEQTKSSIANLRNLMGKKFNGGGLIFDFTKGDKFLNEEQFYQIFNREKIKILSNKRDMESAQFTELLNYFKNINEDTKGKLSEITPDLWIGFVLYVVKFYTIKGKETKDIVNELNETIMVIISKTDDTKKEFQARLDELQDIVVTKDPERKKQAGEEARIAKLDETIQAPAPATTTVTSTPNANKPSTLTLEEAKKTQNGGSKDPYYEKYLKYKNKYMELKNRK